MRPEQRREYHRLYSRKRKEINLSMGMCCKCGERPPVEGRKMCSVCTGKMKARRESGIILLEDGHTRIVCDGDCEHCTHPDCIADMKYKELENLKTRRKKYHGKAE